MKAISLAIDLVAFVEFEQVFTSRSNKQIETI